LKDASGEKLSRLAESSNAAEPMFAYEDRKVPEEEEVCTISGRRWRVEGEETDGRGHPNRQVP